MLFRSLCFSCFPYVCEHSHEAKRITNESVCACALGTRREGGGNVLIYCTPRCKHQTPNLSYQPGAHVFLQHNSSPCLLSPLHLCDCCGQYPNLHSQISKKEIGTSETGRLCVRACVRAYACVYVRVCAHAHSHVRVPYPKWHALPLAALLAVLVLETALRAACTKHRHST